MKLNSTMIFRINKLDRELIQGLATELNKTDSELIRLILTDNLYRYGGEKKLQ